MKFAAHLNLKEHQFFLFTCIVSSATKGIMGYDVLPPELLTNATNNLHFLENHCYKTAASLSSEK